MADRLTIGKVAFDAVAVPGATAVAVRRDPLLAQGAERVVWSWDGAGGRFHGPVDEAGAVPLSNALVMFVPRVTAGGGVGGDPVAAERMGKRFLAATGGQSLPEAVRALSQLVQIPRKRVPLDAFAALKPAGSFALVQETDYAVVQLVNRAEELSAFLCLPNRVSYRAIAPRDGGTPALAEAIAALEAAGPAQTFPVPARARVTRRLRGLALEQRAREIVQAERALPEGAGGDVARQNLARARLRLQEERRAIAEAPPPPH